MVIGFGHHARDDAALLRHPEAFVGTGFFDAIDVHHAIYLGAFRLMVLSLEETGLYSHKNAERPSWEYPIVAQGRRSSPPKRGRSKAYAARQDETPGMRRARARAHCLAPLPEKSSARRAVPRLPR